VKQLIYSICFFLIAVTPIFSQQATIVFQDNFDNYQNGSDGAPIWTITKGLWQIEDGRFVQKTGEYDCGAMLNFFVDYSFELAVNFRVKEGEPGAGFFFHSEDYRATDFSHMSRFESNKTMLIGHFMQAGYECTHSARFPEQDFSKWRRLILRVDQDQRNYTIWLDNQIIAKDEPILFPAGYCGIQSSGGIIEFDNIVLKRLPMKSRPVVLSWLRQFIISEKNELMIPHKARGLVQKVDQNGKLIATIGSPRIQKGQFEHPTSLAQLSNGDLVIGDEGLHRIVVFDKNGLWKKSAGYYGSGSQQLNRPVDITVDRHDHIFIVDQGNNRIQVWDAELKFVTEFGKSDLDQPSAIAIADENIYVLNAGMNQVKIYRWENNKAKWQRDFVFGSGQGRDIFVHEGRIYLSVGNEVRMFDSNGELIKKFTAESINGIYPFGLGMDQNGQIFIADYRSGRLVIVDKELTEPKPEISFPSPRQARIQFSAQLREASNLRVLLQDNLIFQGTSPRNTAHEYTISNLTPSTTYHVQFAPTVKTVPAMDGFSKKYAFITPPEPGKKHYWRLPMVTIIFPNVLDSSKIKPSYPVLPALSQEELGRIKAQIEDGIRFYWMNSRMNLFLDNDWIIIDEPLFHHQIFGSQWWYPPKQEWVIKAIERKGKKVEDYVAVLFLACVRDYNEKTGKFESRGKGGGFTAGIGANSQYGLSYWEVTHAHHGSGNNWLMAHEFHHQLDELFLVSGYPEYWFNHFSPTINTAADFGEHFDGNAWILKNWPISQWYDLKFGGIRFTNDSDMDGIPDDDPLLPMDEKRLNSSPNRKDSDGDGVLDLDEIDFSNWIIEGCGETYGEPALLPNLIAPDTDGDGLSDKIDPYPLYPFEPVIRYGSSSLDDSSNRQFFAKLLDQRIRATVFAEWDSVRLAFGFKMDRLAPIKFMIDADADGWFIGRDNYLIYVKPKDATTLESELVMVNCADPKQWPFHDKELAKKITIASTIKKIGDEYLVTIAVPKNDYTGLRLTPGEKIGVNIGFLVRMDADGHERYLTIFEPNRFFDVDLIQ